MTEVGHSNGGENFISGSKIPTQPLIAKLCTLTLIKNVMIVEVTTSAVMINKSLLKLLLNGNL